MALKRHWSNSYSYSTTTNYSISQEQPNTFLTMGAKQSSMTHSSKRTKRSNSNVKLNASTRATTQTTTNTTTYNGHQPHQSSLKPPLPTTTATTHTNHSVPAKSLINEQACQRWFEQYADPDTPNMISPEGTQRFFEDLGLSVEDVLVIVVAWKMKSETMGYISKEEWMTGMRTLRVDSMEKLKQKRPDLEAVVNDADEMKDVYRYTFGYAKNKDQKCMDVDVACVLWSMMMGQQFPIVAEFIQFLQEKKPVKVINRDQWQSFLEFILTVSSDLSDYDEMSAWPVLLDEFVEWKRQEQQ